MHSSLIGKVEKANRYARELDRISIDRLALTFRGDNDTHHVSLDAGAWHCTCHHFESSSSCVHAERCWRCRCQKVSAMAPISSIPSPPPCGTSMSAVIVYEESSRNGESPCGSPVIGRV